MVLFKGAATSAGGSFYPSRGHCCSRLSVLSQSSNSAQRSACHPGTQSWHRQEAHWRTRASVEPIGNTGGSLLRPPFSTLPHPLLPLALHSPELMACPPHAMTPASCPGRSPPQCPQCVALSTWGTPACSPSNTPLSYLPTAGPPCGTPCPPTSHLTGPWQHPSSELMDF